MATTESVHHVNDWKAGFFVDLVVRRENNVIGIGRPIKSLLIWKDLIAGCEPTESGDGLGFGCWAYPTNETQRRKLNNKADF